MLIFPVKTGFKARGRVLSLKARIMAHLTEKRAGVLESHSALFQGERGECRNNRIGNPETLEYLPCGDFSHEQETDPWQYP